jgi:hypothetical protein
MADPHDLELSSAKKARDYSSAVTKLWVWVLETLGEAIGTCLILVVFAFFQFRHEDPPLGNDLSFYKVLGISAFILIEFAMTGYLATTLISRFALRGRAQQLYPFVCAGLYLLHSTIFFVGAGNPFLRRDDLVIQLCGAILTLACSWGGNRLVARLGRKSA